MTQVSSAMPDGQPLLGMTLDQLQQLCAAEGMPRFAAKQICDWLYAKHVDSIDAMTNLSLKNRSRLKEMAVIGRHAPVECQVSRDGTKKYLFQKSDDPSQFIESVFIPDGDRGTLCVSCQAGCKMGCRFCVTGMQGFHGNLSAADILNQIFSIPEFDCLTNIVFMGMGEPMDNLDNILHSTEALTAPWGLGWSPHRITVSTVGIIPGLRRFLDESQCHVAVSLHNPFGSERQEIMPMQRAYPIADVVIPCSRDLTIASVMLPSWCVCSRGCIAGSTLSVSTPRPTPLSRPPCRRIWSVSATTSTTMASSAPSGPRVARTSWPPAAYWPVRTNKVKSVFIKVGGTGLSCAVRFYPKSVIRV